MQPILSQKQIQALRSVIHELYGLGGFSYLEASGLYLTDMIDKIGIQGRIVVCCGKGDNAAVGLVVARHLANRKQDVETWMAYRPEELSKSALLNYDILDECQDDIGFITYSPDLFYEAVQKADWIVDALLGVGVTGAPRQPVADVIKTINDADKKVIAVDIPSGLDIDFGVPHNPTIIARHTATFIAKKKGFSNPQAKEFLGELHVIDMGIPQNAFLQLPPD